VCHLYGKQSISFYAIVRELHGDIHSVARVIRTDFPEIVIGIMIRCFDVQRGKYPAMGDLFMRYRWQSESENYVISAAYSSQRVLSVRFAALWCGRKQSE
jgi:hypothetical protein